MKIVTALAAACVLAATGCGGDRTPVTWAATLEGGARTATRGAVVRVMVRAQMDSGWYVYSLTQPAGGPIPTRVWVSDTTVFRPAESVAGPVPVRSFDGAFKMEVEKYLEPPVFVLPVRIPVDAPLGVAAIRVSVRYQACNDSICLLPATVTMSVPVRIAVN